METTTMQIDTRRFGTITVADDEQFEVPEGIPGFRAMRHVALFVAAPTEAGDQAMFWMQDLDNGELAFLCVVPWDVFPNYDVEIDEEEYEIDRDSDVRILNLVSIRRSGESTLLTANLRAPLVIDVRRRRIHQVILTDGRWSVHQPVAAPTAISGAH